MSEWNFFDNAPSIGADSEPSRSSSALRLSELLPSATRTSDQEVLVTSCATDWREVKPGDIYIALSDAEVVSGAGEDGHIHAQRAVSHGAIAVVGEQPVPVFDVPTYLVPDSRSALGTICHALMGHPSRQIRVIGVSGTHGKSTTIALLASIFATAGKHCGQLSSLGCYDGMAHSTGISDCPTAPAFASRLSRMEAANCSHALVEISSQSLSQARVAGIELDAVCVTNVTEAHLDLHNTIESYRATERRVLDYLSPGGVAVLNADDPVSMKWLDQLTGPALTYGTQANSAAEVTATVVECQSNEQTVVLSAGQESVALRTTIVGQQHVANCLAAATVSLSYGIDLQTIAAGIEAIERLPARMERIDTGSGFPVFVDAADTAEALRGSLRTARQLAARRVICVWGHTSNLAANERETIAHVLSRMADLAIVAQPLDEIACTLDVQQRASVEVVADRYEAIACAVAMAEPGDVVVIAGSRVDSGLMFAADSSLTNESEVVRQLLYARPEPAFRLVG